MRIYPEKLAQTISQELPAMTWIHGEEHLLIEESMDAIRQEARKQGFDERQVFFVDKKFDWNEVLFCVQDVGLFVDKKLVEIRLSGLPTKAGKEALQNILSSNQGNAVVIITSPKLENSTFKTKWFQAIEAFGVHVPCWPISRDKLSAWLRERARMRQLNIEMPAIALLCDLVEGNLYAARQEIEKLSLLYPQQTISADLLHQAVCDNARYTVFSFIDGMLAGDATRLLCVASGLEKEGQSALGVIALIARELRLLLDLSLAKERGESIATLLSPPRVWPMRKAMVGSALQRHSHRGLHRLMLKCIHLDTVAKTGESGNIWLSIKALAMEVAGVRVWGRPSPRSVS